MSGMSRRGFIVSAVGAMAMGPMVGRVAAGDDTPWAGERIVDCHFHGRPTDEGIIAHLDGAGISNTLILAMEDYSARMPGLNEKYPGRVLGWSQGAVLAPDDPKTQPAVPVDPDSPTPFTFISAMDAVKTLTKAVETGARGFGETAGLVWADGPELQRLYALAAELDVPVMMHFQEAAVPGHPRYGISGFSRIEAMLKKYPNTRFICHASDFWGHIDTEYEDGGAYPVGRVRRGGLTDRLLADYPNMYGDLGAPSGMIQLSRDPEFTAAFLERHQHKLIFGSDCHCTDGRGGVEAGSEMAALMAQGGGYASKCVAREILAVLWRSSDRELFRRLVWENAHKVYRLGA